MRHPLHPPDDRPEIAPAAPDPRHARPRNGCMPGWLGDVAPTAAEPRSSHTAPSPKRTDRKRPAPARNPHSAQIVRPSASRLSKEGLDTRCVRRHRAPRRARCPMRSPRRLGCSDPGLHLLRRSHSTSSPPSRATTRPNDQSVRTSSEFRGARPATTRVRRGRRKVE